MHANAHPQVLLQGIEYSMVWQDDRIVASPCAGSLPALLSISSEQAASDIGRADKLALRSRFWVPRFSVRDLAPETSQWDEHATFGLHPSLTHSGCTENCTSWSAQVTVRILQTGFDYFYYPFDAQTITFDFEIEGGARIQNCDKSANGFLQVPGLTDATANQLLLPSTGQWRLRNSINDSVEVFHPVETNVLFGTAAVNTARCSLRVHVTRNPRVFVLKSLVMTVTVVFASLLSAFFMSFELMGDRFAVLFLAFLIIVTNMQSDLGLGHISCARIESSNPHYSCAQRPPPGPVQPLTLW